MVLYGWMSSLTFSVCTLRCSSATCSTTSGSSITWASDAVKRCTSGHGACWKASIMLNHGTMSCVAGSATRVCVCVLSARVVKMNA